MDLGHQSWFSMALLSGAALAAGLYVTFGPEESKRGRRRRRRGDPPGLPNVGNSCFVNAVLQALAAVPAFRQWLEDEAGDFPEGGVGRSMAAVLGYLHEGREEDACTAGTVLAALRGHGWHIGREEQDALEMLHVCFTSLEEELQRARGLDGGARCKSPLLQSSMADHDGEGDVEMSPAEEAPSPPSSASSTLKRSTSGVFSRCASDLELSASTIRGQTASTSRRTVTPFGGTLANKITFPPGGPDQQAPKKSPVSSSAFNTVSLSLPRSSSPLFGPLQSVTLETLLQIFVSKEAVDDGRCVKQLTFGRLPRCLCFHIQRSDFQGGQPVKRSDAVVLPQYLNMDLFSYTGQIFKEQMMSGSSPGAPPRGQQQMEGDCPQQPQSRLGPRAVYYKLCSVIVHLGGAAGSGHYVTYRRVGPPDGSGGPDRWFVFSDDRVEEVDVARVVRSEAYAVFYEKCDRFSGLDSMLRL